MWVSETVPIADRMWYNCKHKTTQISVFNIEYSNMSDMITSDYFANI